jgi:hypothetical protein
MSLRSPNLDDRSFDQLVEAACRLVSNQCPDWTDLSPGDPGRTLIEVFAYLTDTMLYRLNRLPDKAYVEFLRLIGVRMKPPSAASVMLQFSLPRAAPRQIRIPRGTRVTTERSDGNNEAPVFRTAETVVLKKGRKSVTVKAIHCEQIDAVLLGIANGQPGLSLKLNRYPVIAPTGDALDLVIGVACEEDSILPGVGAVHFQGKTYRIWQEVENFSNLAGDRHVYVADRMAGLIVFAPALRSASGDQLEALAAVPETDREIRAWYRVGGGAQGNVAANNLTVLKDPLPGISVTNPAPATGGQDKETLENALLRGPQELHSLQRAVTSRDYELIALEHSGAVSRAKAFTKANLWAHAAPGTVELLMVPAIANADSRLSEITRELLLSHQTDTTLQQVQSVIDLRKPLGTRCQVGWSNYKSVSVSAKVIVSREEMPAAVKDRLLQRLHARINPLSMNEGKHGGWRFGQVLSAWDIYKIISGEPGVITVSGVSMAVETVPDADVVSLCADTFQDSTWYTASGDRVFRSMNNGDGWEPVGKFNDAKIVKVVAFPAGLMVQQDKAGLLAVATLLPGKDGGSKIFFSRDCGESWEAGLGTRFAIDDMAWMERDGSAILLLATEKGLYELPARAGADPLQVLVDPKKPTLGFHAVTVAVDAWGGVNVAVAAHDKHGVYLSTQSGKAGSFNNTGLKKELVRVLAVQQHGPHRYLWAGTAAIGNDPGHGCFRWRLTGEDENPEGWVNYDQGWEAGGCRALAFAGPTVLAASLKLGVLRLDINDAHSVWKPSDIHCNLPLQEVGRLLPVDTVATDAKGRLLMAGGREGVFRSEDLGGSYVSVTRREFNEKVTLPRTWLFCSGKHAIDVVGEDEAE